MAVTRRSAWLTAVVVVALLMSATLLIGHSLRVAQADTDARDASGQKVLGWGNVARNIIEGGSVAVCTDEYPVAARSATRMWNRHLQAIVRRVACDDLLV